MRDAASNPRNTQPGMAHLATFVFTDLVGSVNLKQRMPGVDASQRDAAYVRQVLQPHRQLIEAGLAEAGGRVVSTAGDGHFLVFGDTARAALWAIGVMRSHRDQPIEIGEGDRAQLRIGMHAGTPQPDPADPDNFIGRPVDYAARLADQAEGDQVLVSRTTASLIEDGGLEGVAMHSHGGYDLRGIGEAELFELLYDGRKPAPPRSAAVKAPDREWSTLPRTMALTEYVAQSTEKPASSATAVRPRRVGNYELGELLGAGGMGNVYKARHSQFNRPRAVKIIRPDLVEAGGESVVHRFYQEIRATGSLEHPNLVVAIDSSSPEDDEHYLVMEYVDGVGVDRLLEIEGALPAPDACEIARQAALGLAHLHEQGLVHRDVKPSNLMLTLAASPHLRVDSSETGARSDSAAVKLPLVKLMDLGLALLLQSDEDRLTRFDRGGMGTGHYMPPEQWQSTSVDIRADIYSLGCTLFHLLMGQPPFAHSDLRPERAHATETPPDLRPPTGAPKQLVELVTRMLAKDPTERPQTPAEVADALGPIARGQQLAERLSRARGGAATGIRSIATETRPAPGGAEIETRPPTGRRLVGDSTQAVARKSPWLLVAATTIAAVAAVLGLTYANEARKQSHFKTLSATAGFAAGYVDDAINKRVRTLMTLAERAELRDLVRQAAGGERQALQDWLEEKRDEYDQQLELRSSSWFVTDRLGTQIARDPPTQSIGKNFAHRDYFHGQDLDLSQNPDPRPDPIAEPHQSAVYTSSSNNTRKIAFSTPIRDDAEVIGVLAMSVGLGDFDEFHDVDSKAGSVEFLLVDLGVDRLGKQPRRGLILHHRNLRAHTHDGPVWLSEELVEQVLQTSKEKSDAILPPYSDVFGRKNRSPMWGAVNRVIPHSLSPEQRHAWVVIAQESEP